MWQDISKYSKPAKILEYYHVQLDVNPFNCDYDTYRFYKFLLSFSRSEKPDLDPNHLPDFSFYEDKWKYVNPSQWAGIPLMKIPEF